MTEDSGLKKEESTSTIHPPSSVTRHLIFWPIFAGGLILDLWTKKAVFAWLENVQGHGVAVIDNFLRLQLAINPGAAFGIAGGHRVMLVSISVIALFVILGVFIFALKEGKTIIVALALFAAGIAGNLYDRAFNDGLVRDFIDVMYWPGKHWPAFNVADSMLCSAVGLLIIASLLSQKSCQTPAHPQK